MRNPLASRFCECIKKVRKTVKLRTKKTTKERAAIGICVKSVLQTRGRTLKKFRCLDKEMLMTSKKGKDK